MAKGKGKSSSSPLNEIDPAQKVWVGNLPDDVDWKAVQEHFNNAGATKWVEILPKGAACVAYKSAQDAKNAISMLNGTPIDGNALVVDTWSTKTPRSTKGSSKGTKSWTPVWKPAFIKKGASGKGKGKGKDKANPLSKIDPSLKVWVGNIPANVDWKELQGHFNQAGDTKWVEKLPGGAGCVAYKTEEEVANAIEALNGTALGGQALTVDVWTKKE